MVIHIPTLQSMYSVITACDPILHEYYITGSYKNMNYGRYDTGRCSRARKESRELYQGNESGRSATWSSSLCQVSILGLAMLSLSTPINNRNSPMSKLQNLDVQVQVYQNATQRVHKSQVACTTCTENR